MEIIREFKENDKRGGISFYCPGCKDSHVVYTFGDGVKWQWNGNKEKPTISPSVLVRWGSKPGSKRCHLFVRNGQIQYLNDCTHEFIGKTVDMIDFNDV